MGKKFLALMSIVGLAFSVSACDKQQASVSSQGSSPSVSASPSVSESASESSSSEVNKTPKLGETVTYPDGLAITVKDLGKFKPGQFASGAEKGTPHKIQITLKNGTDKPVKPATFNVVASSGGQEASQVLDLANGLDFPPSTSVLPGKSITWVEGYAFADPKDVTLEVQAIDFKHENVVFSR
ncbi:hypothetical protein ACTOVL_05845 [Arcanobacterium canis]